LNYTVGLLIGVACEALEDAGAYPNKKTVFAELLPDDDWRQLKDVLFDALRNGLAHNFDMKHIHVDGETHPNLYGVGAFEAYSNRYAKRRGSAGNRYLCSWKRNLPKD
jgi:hypothetical protein